MKNLIIDSSSAILLYRSNTIEAMLRYCNLIIPGSVLSELTVPGHHGADLFEELVRTGVIKVLNPDKICDEELIGSLHAGERGVIALFDEGKGDFIIIDDGRGAAFCRDNNIPYINALLAVKILFMKSIISDAEYAGAWNWLRANGRYSDKVIDWAECADERILAAFL